MVCASCQGFSSLGSRRSGDARNDLALEVLRFTEEFRPRAVVVENVPRFVRHPHCAELLTRLESCGYGAATRLVAAAACGAPQRRRRVLLVALRDRPASCLPSDLSHLLPDGSIVAAGPVDAVLARAAALPGAAFNPLARSRTLSPLALAPPGRAYGRRPPRSSLRSQTALPHAPRRRPAAPGARRVWPPPRRRARADDDDTLHHRLFRSICPSATGPRAHTARGGAAPDVPIALRLRRFVRLYRATDRQCDGDPNGSCRRAGRSPTGRATRRAVASCVRPGCADAMTSPARVLRACRYEPCGARPRWRKSALRHAAGYDWRAIPSILASVIGCGWNHRAACSGAAMYLPAGVM